MDTLKDKCLDFQCYFTSNEVPTYLLDLILALIFSLYASIAAFKYYLYVIHPIKEDVDRKTISKTRISEAIIAQILLFFITFELYLGVSSIFFEALRSFTFYSLVIDLIINFIILLGHPRLLLSAPWLLFEIHVFLLKLCIYNLYFCGIYEIILLIVISFVVYCCYGLFWRKENLQFPILK